MKISSAKLYLIFFALVCGIVVASVYVDPLRRTFIGRTSRFIFGEPFNFSKTHEPEYVIIGTGSYGLCIGTTNYIINFDVFYSRKISDGVYTFFRHR